MSLHLSYIVAVAVVNLMLGFAVAAHLGRRHGRSSPAARMRRPALPASVPAPAPQPKAPAATPQEVTATAAPAESPPAVEAPPAEGPPSPDVLAAAAFTQMGGDLNRYQDLVADVDERLRECVRQPQRQTVEECLESLKSASTEFEQTGRRSQADLGGLNTVDSEYESLCDSMQDALEQHTATLQAARAAADAFDYEGDLSAGCLEMADHTGRLLAANDQLRDTLDGALTAVVRHCPETAAGQDPGAARRGLSRADLESELRAWWQSDPKQPARLCAAVMDVDRFKELNDRYGHRLGDKILRTIAELLARELEGKARVARMTGEAFLFLVPDADLHAAANLLDRQRQTLERAHFRYHDYDIRATASCGVTEVAAEDDEQRVFERLEQTVREAKRYGRNRTFVHEGQYPTPVISPSYEPEEYDLSL